MIKTIVIRREEIDSSIETIRNIYKEKYFKWIDEEFDKGWLIETLRFDFYSKDYDISVYCDIEYRAKADEIHLEMLERLTIGL